MTTTAVRTALRERIDPVLEEMITRELIGQGAPLPVIPGAQQQPGAPLAALAPALMAVIASQQQQVPVPQPQPPLATLVPILATTLAGQQQPIPMQQAVLIPALLAAVAGQGPQQSPLAALLPVLTAALAAKPQPIP